MATKSYKSGNIESTLHDEITDEAKRNGKSFSAQIKEYKDRSIKLEEQVSGLMTENKTLKEASWPKKAQERRK